MRKLGLLTTLWTVLLWLPLSVFALGLGDLKVDSFLNQPLKAEIEVTAARPGEVDDLLVSLASRDSFRKAGLERPAALSKLRFRVEKSEDGQSARVLITSKTAIKEPFLNFLVEADWAKGRLLREYTILLDPPYFAQQPAPQPALTSEPAPAEATAAPVEQAIAPVTPEPQAEAVDAQPIALSEQPEETFVAEPAAQPEPQYAEPAAATDVSSGGEVVVQKGDTLWALASPYKDAQHSMAQVMLAIQAANPDAFGDGNINNLKVGAVLRMPEGSDYGALSKQQAYAQVLEQNGLWDEYVARKTGAAVPGTPVAADTTAASEAAEESGQLNLIAPGDDDTTTASLTDDGADVGQLRKQLALAEEELEASRLENQDLRSRVTDLEAQISKMEELQKLVQVEDSTLAQLQQQKAEETPADTTTTGVVEEQPSDIMVEAADKIMAEESEQAETGEAVSEEADEIVTDSTEAETVIPTTGEEEVTAEDDDRIVEEAEPAPVSEPEPEPVSEPEPAPVVVTSTEPDDASGFLPPLGSLLGDPIILGGIAVILLLVGGLVFVKRRKSAAEEEGITLDVADDLVDDDATPIHMPSEDDAAAALAVEALDEALEGPAETDELAQTAIVSADEMPTAEAQAEEGGADQDDVLNEADVYLAYGLYDNAEELLKESLQNSPDRADYRAKLLDTYFATKNSGEFVKEAEALRSLGGAADRFWDRVQIMGYELAPDNALFAGAGDSDLSVDDISFAKPESADFDIGGEDESDFSDTDFDLSGVSEAASVDQTELMGDLSDEFVDTQTLTPIEDDSLELPDIDELNAEASLTEEIGEFDIDLEDSTLEETGEISSVDSTGEDESLSFDLPEDLDLSTDLDVSAGGDDEGALEIEDTFEAPTDELEISLEDEALGSSDEIEIDIGEELQAAEAEQESLGEETLVIDADQGMRNIDDTQDLDVSDIDLSELDLESAGAEDDITEFRPTEMTGEYAIPDLDDIDASVTEEVLSEVDADAGIERTGTFAPGDFGDDDLESAVSQGMDDIEDLMLPDDVDEVGTKLDLAKAFIDMGDAEGARSSLEEVLEEGTDEQKAEASGLLEQIK